MKKLILSFYMIILSSNIMAGTYDAQIQQAMRDCDIARNQVQSSYHDNGSACERAQQLIELQKAEYNQSNNLNVHVDDNR